MQIIFALLILAFSAISLKVLRNYCVQYPLFKPDYWMVHPGQPFKILDNRLYCFSLCLEKHTDSPKKIVYVVSPSTRAHLGYIYKINLSSVILFQKNIHNAFHNQNKTVLKAFKNYCLSGKVNKIISVPGNRKIEGCSNILLTWFSNICFF